MITGPQSKFHATRDILAVHSYAFLVPGSEPTSTGPEIVAYKTGAGPDMPLVPASISRQWMNATRDRFANRCLPLRLANQAGWFVLNPKPMAVSWDGGIGRSSLTIKNLGNDPHLPVSSTFGHGILTFHPPYLFRTSAGFNLLARGPANCPKDGVYALEGLVETDWAVATFTMNWKLTRPGLEVRFEVGEPVCMIVPQRRNELGEFRASIGDVDSEPALADQYHRWAASREERTAEVRKAIMSGIPQTAPSWELDYTRGTSPGGAHAEVHQTRLKLSPFSGDTSQGGEERLIPDV